MKELISYVIEDKKVSMQHDPELSGVHRSNVFDNLLGIK